MANPEDVVFKQKFIDRYSSLTDWKVFQDYSLRFLRRCIRVNTLKISVEDVKKRLEPEWQLDPVPWCREGFYIEHRGDEVENKEGDIELKKRRDIGNLPEHSLGYIYVQEAASMIPPIVLGPRPGEVVLDMCASPGSKATQIAQYMQNTGVFVANDFRIDRIQSLSLNLQRIGVSCNLTTMMEGRFFARLAGKIEFDRILVDAPCSGTGTIRKSLKTIKIWNPVMVKRLAGTQKQLIKTAFDLLKPGGTMVYSTCTLEPEEDEGVVSWLMENNESAFIEKIAEDELPGLKRSAPVMEFDEKKYHKHVSRCIRIWPQDNNTEGFFVARIGKK